MKYLFISLLFLVSCQKQESNKDQKFTKLAKEQIAKDLIQGAFDDLWAGVDSTKIAKYHTDDFILLEHGEVWDNSRIKVYMNGQLARKNRAKRINRMEYISIDDYDESIMVSYYNFAEFRRADTLVGKAKWLESALAIPTEDGWRLRMMHSTRVKN